jgi:uncharacterized protein
MSIAQRIDDVPGWEGLLAAEDTFYLSPDWLRFADADGEADARYLVHGDADDPVVGLPAHWAHGETNPEYVPRNVVPRLAAHESDLLTLGGRRGYLSTVASCDGAEVTRVLPDLIAEAMGSFESEPSGWWWPYLPTRAAEQVVEAVSAAHEPVVTLVDADCRLDVAGSDLDDYLATLSTAKRRTNARRERKWLAESGLTVTRERLEDCLERAGELLSNVQQRHDQDNPPSQMTAVLEAQAERLGDRAVFFGCRDGGELVAFSLNYRWHDELLSRLVGLDYEHEGSRNAYGELLVYQPLLYCYEEGLKSIHLGAASLSGKSRRGARIRPLWAVSVCECTACKKEGGREALSLDKLDELCADIPDAETAAFVDEVHSFGSH